MMNKKRRRRMIVSPTTGVTCRRRRMESRRREEEKKNMPSPEVFLSPSMNCRSSIAADGERIWCMSRVWWKELSGKQNRRNEALLSQTGSYPHEPSDCVNGPRQCSSGR
uniref:Uncharacterized protein n=1 Tax=Nelumbo nucifera TaxID=4432 RepID=A0A822ZR01_NELNU|nr:TPA_asm: hypothetical protein HUJ06_003596 [Nelumbo nucifera]